MACITSGSVVDASMDPPDVCDRELDCEEGRDAVPVECVEDWEDGGELSVTCGCIEDSGGAWSGSEAVLVGVIASSQDVGEYSFRVVSLVGGLLDKCSPSLPAFRYG
jgi:hypothetical protein